MTFDAAVSEILAARSAVELFGNNDQLGRYRTLAKVVHPDRASAADTGRATAAFARLSELWAQIKSIVISDYSVRSYLGHYDLADWFLADSNADVPFYLKIINQPANNDLMRREVDNLKRLWSGMNPRYEAFFPRLKASFPYRDENTDADRLVNVFASDVEFYSLATISDSFPHGLDGRHVAWIWRRLLVALDVAHQQSIIHGAVTPDNVLINPKLHGLRLSNWCYSASGSQHVPALVRRYKTWYHDDIVKKKTPTPETDIWLATKTITSLLEPGAPEPLQRFGRASLSLRRTGPRAAFRLLAELDTVLETVYGPRKFTVFPDLPANTRQWPQT